MTKFGMSSIDAAVKFAIQHDPATDPSPDCHIDQSRLVPPGAPTCLGQCGCIRIIFHSNADVENALQVCHRPFLPPSGKKINVAELPGDGVHRARGSNSDS